ncbi:MAG TPA: metallophosphoesterase [Clostridia bacterium]|nr:metallophosphoesterase [Clostridia bacterium]
MKKKYLIIFLICAGIFAAIVTAAFYNGLVVRSYTVRSDKLEPESSVRAVLITDLHSHIYGENQRDLLTLIDRQKPDIILLAGDIADDVEPFEGAQLFFAGVSKIAPAYYVSGNHDIYLDNAASVKRTIRSFGISVLESSFEKIKIRDNTLIVAGVDDPDIERYDWGFDWEDSMVKAFSGLDREQGYKILVAHRPELIDIYGRFDFDLIVSGHAHGGQARIPFLVNGLYSPGEGWFPKHAGGAYKYGNLTRVVSRGLSNNFRLPRVFNPPEIVVIDIKTLH